MIQILSACCCLARAIRMKLSSWILIVWVFLGVQSTCSAQADKDCEELKKQITALQEALTQETAVLHDLEPRLEKQRALHQNALDAYKKLEKSGGSYGTKGFGALGFTEEFRGELLDKLRKGAEGTRKLRDAIEETKLTIQATKDVIADLLNKLGDCGKKKPEGAPTASPSAPESAAIDPQLIGTWECISFKESVGSVTGGGTGFRVTFKSDGTESVDYSNMKPVMSGLRDKTTYSGTAMARISTNDGVAKIEKMVSAGAVMTVDSATGHFSLPKLPGLGPGGLGSTADKNSYKCSEDTLEYQTSAARDGHANTTVKLTRVKEQK
jgi:hypothetical protein